MKRSIKLVLAVTAVGIGVGCTNFAVTDLLNPAFLDTLTGNTSQAALPGDAPTVLVSFDNRTSNPCAYTITYRTVNDAIETLDGEVGNGIEVAQAVPCPVFEITVGEITDLSESGVIVGLGGLSVNDPFIQVEPFGVLLREGVNFDCGDAVTFVLVETTATRTGYRVLAFVEQAG
jgi:hypothetical protein